MADKSLTMRISLIARILRTRFDRRARDIGLTRAQWRTIACIRAKPGATQHKIAMMLEVGDVTAGRSIDRLAEAGWVERQPDPNDRRMYRIHLTSAVAPVLERLSAIAEDEDASAFAGFSAAELVKLDDMLHRVTQNLTCLDVDGNPSLGEDKDMARKDAPGRDDDACATDIRGATR